MSSVEGKVTWWTIEFEEMTPFDSPDFRTDLKALEYVAKLRALNDPAFKPAYLVKHVAITTETTTKMSLGPDSTEVVAAVKKKLVSMKGLIPEGEDSLAWAVNATIEAMGR